LQERAEDFSFCEGDDGVDGAEAFGPCAAEEFHEDGFGLVVKGVGGEDGVGVAGVEEGGEEVVACVAGGFFDGFVSLGYAVGNVGMVEMKGDVEADAEIFDESLVGIGFFAAETVVDVDGRETDADGFAGGCVRCMKG
jgi:hypothetical protein